MKVVMLVGGLPPEYTGGAEIAALQLAECASKMGHEIHIITIGAGKVNIEGVNIYRIKTVNVKYIRGIACVLGALSVIKKLHPDIVHVQSVYMVATAIVARRILHIPYLLYERGGVSMPIKINKYIYPIALRNAERVIAQTEEQKNTLTKYYQRSIEVIPNGINVEWFGKVDKYEARRVLGIPGDKKVVLAVGRCRPEKNMRGFVLASKEIDAICILVGDGPQLNELKKLNSGVVFTGGVSNGLIPAYMAAADVLVNTSFSEGFPLTILEGMASGLSVVAPRICGIPEIIDDEINGLLSEPKDYHSTALMVNRILRDGEMAERISKNNKEKARLYTWENVVKKLYG